MIRDIEFTFLPKKKKCLTTIKNVTYTTLLSVEIHSVTAIHVESIIQ